MYNNPSGLNLEKNDPERHLGLLRILNDPLTRTQADASIARFIGVNRSTVRKYRRRLAKEFISKAGL